MATDKAPFFSRHIIVERLTESTQTEPPAGFAIVGARMTGKSALLHHLASCFRQNTNQARAPAAAEGRLTPVYLDCTLLEKPEELWSRLYTTLTHLADPAGAVGSLTDGSPPQWRQLLTTLVRERRTQGQRSIFLLDNFDHLLATDPCTPDLCTALSILNTLAVVILTTCKPLYDVNSGRAVSRLISNMTQLFLGLIEEDTATSWLAHQHQGVKMAAAVRTALLACTGRHPYLLDKVGECLAEMQLGLPAVQEWRKEHLPFLQLRLAEHGRPLFLTQWHLLAEPPATIGPAVMTALVERLRRGPLPPDETPREWLPALNWLFNQALVAYHWGDRGPVYTIYSPLLLDFLNHTALPTPAVKSADSAPTVDPAVYQNLTKIEASLLRYFEQHSQTLVSTDQLLADVWRRPNASTRRVQEAIRRLRLQLEQQAPPIGEIKNERGRGYRFVPASSSTNFSR